MLEAAFFFNRFRKSEANACKENAKFPGSAVCEAISGSST